ncbi:MAG: hypothetical protein ACLP05_07955 [Candidatus Kryptoniota bacterium]
MRWVFLVLTMTMFCSQAKAQENDTTYSQQGGVIDSLRTELKKLENAYQMLKTRTDSTQQLTEADREELDKLSDSLRRIGEEIRAYSDDAARLGDEAAKIYDVENAITKNGDYTLGEAEVSDDNLKVLNGDAFIYGTINGTLVVVNGNAYVRHGAKIGGDIIVVNGIAQVSDYASVEGNVIEREGSDLEERNLFTQRLKLAEHPDIWQNRDFIFDKLAADYNRVDGLFLGLGTDKDYFWGGEDEISPYGFAGYAFSLHKWRYQLGLDKWFGNEDRFELGVEAHSLTDSKDSWVIGPKEDFVYSILAREDFMDYYSRQGASFHVAQYYEMNSRITLSYDVDKYSSLTNNTNWSIFGGDKVFRDNPAITDGWMRSLAVDVEHRNYTGDKIKQGWLGDLHCESTLSGAFDFRILTADVVRYQSLVSGVQLNLRFRAGTSSGELPLQKSYQLGGFNTLNAFPLYAFPGDSLGNRMLLFNFEFLFNQDLFERTHVPLLDDVALILFGDVGQVKDAGASPGLAGGWGVITSKDFKSDFGVGIGNDDGAFKIFVAWRTDVAASPTFGIRLAGPF